MVVDLKITLTPTDKSPKQKINKEKLVLNDTLDQKDLTDIFRTFHPNAEEYAFFSSGYETFSRIDHILGHNQTSVNLRKLKSYQASSLTTTRYQLQEKNCKKHKHMETKQHISK